jgi:hypothetical protein
MFYRLVEKGAPGGGLEFLALCRDPQVRPTWP